MYGPARGTLARKNELEARRTSIIRSEAPHPPNFPFFGYFQISRVQFGLHSELDWNRVAATAARIACSARYLDYILVRD